MLRVVLLNLRLEEDLEGDDELGRPLARQVHAAELAATQRPADFKAVQIPRSAQSISKLATVIRHLAFIETDLLKKKTQEETMSCARPGRPLTKKKKRESRRTKEELTP